MIELKYPCPENGREMEQVHGGKHCQTCDKVLVDFTGMTGEQIFEIKRNNPGVCGTFRKSQIKGLVHSENRSIFRIAFTLIFLLGINTNILFSQTCNNTSSHNVKIEQSESEKTQIEGLIKDYDGKAIEGAKIKISSGETVIELVSDKDGKFKIQPPFAIKAKEVELLITHPDWLSERIKLSDVSGAYKLTVTMDYEEMIDGMMIDGW